MTEEQSDRELLLAICQELLQSLERFLLTRQLGTQRLRFTFFHLNASATEVRWAGAEFERSASAGLICCVFVSNSGIAGSRYCGAFAGRAYPGNAGGDRASGVSRQDRPAGRRYSIAQLAERLVARIGDQSVHSVTTVAEHRPQRSLAITEPVGRAERSQLVSGRRRPAAATVDVAGADVVSRLNRAIRLHHGSPDLLEGPERLETGWWDEDGIARDYYTAVNPQGMRLWVFRNRSRTAELVSAWHFWMTRARYAELHALSNFTFLRGASHPEELVETAAALGYEALAITDECSMSGIVRAHMAAKQYGLQKLIIGSELRLQSGRKLVVLAQNRNGYAALMRADHTAHGVQQRRAAIN